MIWYEIVTTKAKPDSNRSFHQLKVTAYITTSIIDASFVLKVFETLSGIHKQPMTKDLKVLNIPAHPTSPNNPKFAPFMLAFNKLEGGACQITTIILVAQQPAWNALY